ncbi:MAG TPA: glycoside hydrolase family 127 protein [Acidobacteriota bacterium]|nr:glycoside hydrolase family 127 protein [Acidobacteriota bacterium]
MKTRRTLFFLLAGVFALSASTRADLQPRKLRPFPLGSVKPAGWIKEQLEIQANGLSGHLDEFWPDIKDSGWIGGRAEGWERAPYWLDGLVPLAYLLDQPSLKAKAQRFIDYTLSHQAEDGWLGPEKSAKGDYQARDPWPVYVMLKVLTQYHEATSDPRVIPAVTRFLKNLDRQLNERPLFEWNRMRWQDGALSVYWLYEKTGDAWLLELARKMKTQGYNWEAHFRDLPHKERVQKWEHESHVVNNAMGIKSPAVTFRLSGDQRDAEIGRKAIEVLDRYHGQVSGLFSGDENFAGRMPSQGTETCAVVEYLFSLENLLQVIDDPSFGDRLEQIAFNALPAPFKPDMWARQYVQQANQPIVKVSKERIYTTNGEKANLYGLEANYGCCTANMHQGWPKFVTHLWMQTQDGGIAAVAYAPSRLSTTVQGVPISIELITDYPFSSQLKFVVETASPLTFPLHLRIPGWAQSAVLAIDGLQNNLAVKQGSPRFETIKREWKGKTEVVLTLGMTPRIERRYRDAIALWRGPLVFSLKIGEDWRKVAGEEPHADWEVWPTTAWNYGLVIDEKNPQGSIEVEAKELKGNPFSQATTPVTLKVKGRRIPEWRLVKNAADAPPQSPVVSSSPLETLTLIPYGAAKLRITEFPVVK